MTHVCDGGDSYAVVVPSVPGSDAFRCGDALVVIDEQKRVRQWNAAAEALTGIPSSAAVGRKCWEVMGGRTDGGTVVCGPACDVVSRGDVPHFGLVINTARCKRRVLMSTLVVTQCLDRRLPDLVTVAREVAAWETRQRGAGLGAPPAQSTRRARHAR
jgi:PAS domain-containing protein